MDPTDNLIRKATADDIDDVFQIELGGSGRWKKEYFISELETTFSTFLVLLLSGEIIGFAVVWKIIDAMQLNNIGIKKPYRKSGYGTLLMEYIIANIVTDDSEKIFLEVNEKNQSARGFYKNFGFIETGVRKNYYNEDDAVLMEKVL